MAKTQKGRYWHVSRLGSAPVRRPNRLSAGMTETSNRSNHVMRLSRDALSLVVSGTTDTLDLGMKGIPNEYVKREPCPCCGVKQNGPLAITGRGRRRLDQLRAKRSKQ